MTIKTVIKNIHRDFEPFLSAVIIGVLAPPFNGTVPLREGDVVPFCIARSPLTPFQEFSVTVVTIGDTAGMYNCSMSFFRYAVNSS